MSHPLWDALSAAKEYRWVDLTHPLTNDSPYWPGIPDGSVNLGATVFDWGNPILECEIQTFTFPGQFGTHVDFPGHFIRGRELAKDFAVQDLVFPLCVVDVTDKVQRDVHYAVTAADLQAYEAEYGPIPAGAFVALRTGWSKRWPSFEALTNPDRNAAENAPGWSLEALRYIYEERQAGANGHETLNTDASVLAAEAGDLAGERYVLDQGKVQVELMANLDKVAPAGAIVIVSVPRIECANGLPARVWAITP